MSYRFGDYTLDTQRYELRRAGTPIPLRRKVYDLLAYLLTHRDRVVSKDEVLSHLWPDQIVSPSTLDSCLMEARRAVGDQGRSQDVIRTLRGLGYRFVANVAPQSVKVEPSGIAPRYVWPTSPTTRSLTPFVGRLHELSILQTLWAQTRSGQGQVVGITGDAGIGKSRLLDEFQHRVVTTDSLHVQGRCLPDRQTVPYALLQHLLQCLCGLTEADAGHDVATKISRQLRDVALFPGEEAPYLQYLLGEPGQTEALARLSSQAIKTRMFAALVRLLVHGSQQHPLLLAIEDLHWIDASSEEWLTGLVHELVGVPILLLTTYRPGYQASWFDKSYASQIALRPLSGPDARVMLQAILGHVRISAERGQTILHKAEGNPFFLEELAHAASDHDTAQAFPTVPDTIRAVLAARMDRLPPAAKSLLDIAAVLGKEAPLALLCGVADLPDHQLTNGLNQLQAAELVYTMGHLPAPLYTFKHALTREAAYRSLSQPMRRQYHQQVAQALMEQFPTMAAQHPEWVASHYTEAGLTTRAIPYWHRAGQQAAARSAYPEAIAHLTQALELLRALPATCKTVQQELDVRLTLGPALIAIKGYADSDVHHTYTRLYELCQQQATPQLAPALLGLLTLSYLRAEHRTALALAKRLRELGEQQQDSTLLLEAHLHSGSILWSLGAFAEAQTHLEASARLYDPAVHGAHTFRYGQDPGVVGLAFMGLTLWMRGSPDQALRKIQEACALARTLDQPYNLAFAQVLAAILHFFRRDAPEAQEYAQMALSLARSQEFAHWQANATILQGWALGMQGHERGIPLLRQGLAAWRQIGTRMALPSFLAMLAEVLAQADQIDQGLHVLTEALALVDETEERFYEAELYRLRGELRLRQGHADAESWLQQALTVAQRQQAKAWELRTAVSLSYLWQQQGKRRKAYTLLSGIYHGFTEGSTTPDIQEARDLLNELA
jgi:predicted ATPase/DNA-binding winged helix-turn-helix (wHTH) protein